MLSNKFLKKDYILYIFIIITAAMGWFTKHIDRTFVKKYNPSTILFVETIIIFIVINIAIYLKFFNNIKEFYIRLKEITIRDYIIFTVLGIYSVIVTLFSLYILKHHDIAKIEIYNLLISIPISAIGIYLFLEDEFTKDKILGLCFIALGAFFFNK